MFEYHIHVLDVSIVLTMVVGSLWMSTMTVNCPNAEAQTVSDTGQNRSGLSRHHRAINHILIAESGETYPVNFPIRQYPGSTIITTNNAADPQARSRLVTLYTSDSFGKVQKFYKDELSTGGWRIDHEAKGGGSGTYNFVAMKGKLQVSMDIMTGPKTVTVQLNSWRF